MTPLIYLVLQKMLENDLKTIAGYPKWPNEIHSVISNLLNLAG